MPIELTKRHVEILQCLTFGFSNPEIAKSLGTAVKTIENHIRTILERLGAKNRTHAVVIALKYGIVKFPGNEDESKGL